jgi:uncharacterized protein (DUF1778 family)
MSSCALNVRILVEDKSLLEKICKARGEDLSDFVRRSVRKELASLSYLSDEEKKALGVKTEKSNQAEGV